MARDFFSLHELGLPAVLSVLSDDLEGGVLLSGGNGVYRFSDGRLEQVFARAATDASTVAPGMILAAVSATSNAENTQLYRIRKIDGMWKSEQLTGWQSGGNLTRDNSGAILTTCPGGWCEMPANPIVAMESEPPHEASFASRQP